MLSEYAKSHSLPADSLQDKGFADNADVNQGMGLFDAVLCLQQDSHAVLLLLAVLQ